VALFWWKDIMQLAEKYIPLCRVSAVKGDMFLFWSDLWHHRPMQYLFPRLHSFALDSKVSIGEFYSTPEKSKFFELPLSQHVFFLEFQEMQHLLTQDQLDHNVADKWSTRG
jgi:hypothetical protein